jgi:hypothetical protein
MLRWFGVDSAITPPGARQRRIVSSSDTGSRSCSMMSQPVITSKRCPWSAKSPNPPSQTSSWKCSRAWRVASVHSSIPKGFQPRRRATARKSPAPQPTSSRRPGARCCSMASSQLS